MITPAGARRRRRDDVVAAIVAGRPARARAPCSSRNPPCQDAAIRRARLDDQRRRSRPCRRRPRPFSEIAVSVAARSACTSVSPSRERLAVASGRSRRRRVLRQHVVAAWRSEATSPWSSDEAVPGQRDRRRHQLLPGHRAVLLAGRLEAGDRAGHADGQVAVGAGARHRARRRRRDTCSWSRPAAPARGNRGRSSCRRRDGWS